MGQHRHGTILIVDDDGDIVDAIHDVLAREGYRVRTAGSGLEALTVLGAERVDLILLDLLMPAMSGWELLEQKGGDPALADTPVIVISAAPKEIEATGNVREVLQKPFERGVLLAAVAKHLAHTASP